MSGAKKLQPPGRRGSAQAKRFEGDELAEGIEGGLRRRGAAGEAEVDGDDEAAAAEAEAARVEEERSAAAAEAERVEKHAAVAAAAAAAAAAASAAAEAVEADKLRKQEQIQAAKAEESQRKIQLQQQQEEEQQQQQRQQERARQLELQQQEQEQQKEQEDKRERERQTLLNQQAERARAEQLQQEEQREREQAQQREMEEKIAAARAEKEAQRQRELEEEARAAARDKEQEWLASQQRANDAALAAAAITASESAALDEARRKAEEIARKRAMFLSDVNDFSTTFGDKAREAEEQRRLLEEREGKVLTQGMTELSSSFVPPPAATKQSAAAAAPGLAPAPALEPPVVPTLEEQQRLRQQEEERQRALQAGQVPRDDGSSKAAFSELSSSLFATRHSTAGGEALDLARDAGSSAGAETEVLRMPSRIGQSGKPIGTPQLSSTAAYPEVEEEEEEGMGADESISNVLTMEERRALTPQDRAAWRALQLDLTTRRREFHGAVTYAFDGIFSWQMYGSAEAVDETGAAYTEYLMRCQWGTSWENMQPWISARRYREFDALDADLKRAFPSMEHSMPRLPAKDFFRFLEQDVIEKRRGTLENYMTRIVAHLPTILRSSLFSEFLGIGERIATIKPMLGLGAPSVGPTRGASAGGEQLRARGGTSSSGTTSAGSATGSAAGGPASGLMGEGKVDLDASGLILTVDQAEIEKAAKGSVFFIDSELSLLEEQIRDLTLLLRSARPQELLLRNQRAYYLLVAVTSEWPRLRATAGTLLSRKILHPCASPRFFTLTPHPPSSILYPPSLVSLQTWARSTWIWTLPSFRAPCRSRRTSCAALETSARSWLRTNSSSEGISGGRGLLSVNFCIRLVELQTNGLV